jgi:hypothetical protein
VTPSLTPLSPAVVAAIIISPVQSGRFFGVLFGIPDLDGFIAAAGFFHFWRKGIYIDMVFHKGIDKLSRI